MRWKVVLFVGVLTNPGISQNARINEKRIPYSAVVTWAARNKHRIITVNGYRYVADREPPS